MFSVVDTTDKDRYFARFGSRRSVVYSTRGIVASSQPLAAQAGLDVLKAGGNAADAAAAVSAALCVTETCSTSLGGDSFCLFWNNKDKRMYALNGSGRAPQGLTIDLCKQRGLTKAIDPASALAVTVPGTPAALCDAIEHFGSHKVSREQIFAPAIFLAENGYAVSEVTAIQWIEAQEYIRNASPGGAELLLADGQAPKPGQVFRSPTYARALRKLATEGKDGFYRGEVAEAIVKVLGDLGGVMTLEDLAAHESTFEDPICASFHGHELWECAPNGAGLVALLALSYIRELEKAGKVDLASMAHNSPEYLHMVIEALRNAYADGYEFVADQAAEGKVAGLVQALLAPEYTRERIKKFSPDGIDTSLAHGSPVHGSDTVYMCVTDSEGNACSFISSHASNYGMGAVAQGFGFPLQNRGSGFSLDPTSYNALKPGKRPYHTIIPAMITRDGQFDTVFGVMGGFMQPQGHLQVLLNLLVHGHTPQEALDAPRVCIKAALRIDPESLARSEVFVEEGVDPATIEALGRLGHTVTVLTEWKRAQFGRGQVIRMIDGVWWAGSDLRGDGHAVPW